MNWIEAQHEMEDGNMVTNGYDGVFKLGVDGLLWQLDLVKDEWFKTTAADLSLRELEYDIYETRSRKNFSEALRLMLDGKQCEFMGDPHKFDTGCLTRYREYDGWKQTKLTEEMVRGDWYELSNN